jgi:hypothetical protein
MVMIPPYICAATPTTPNWFPAKLPGATRTYGFNVAALISPEDIFQTITAQTAPSGSGELALTDLTVEGDVLYLTTSSGVGTRVYTIKFVATCFDGQIYEWLIYQAVPPDLVGYTIPVAPSPGFGPAQTWIWNASFDFSNVMNSSYIALLGGIG